MLTYQYLEDLFRAVIKADTIIDGRLFVCPNWGKELNGATIQQYIDSSIPQDKQEFPCALLLPFAAEGNTVAVTSSKLQLTVRMLFLCTANATGGGAVKSPDITMNKSTHTTLQDWSDMMRCAIEFMTVLDMTTKMQGLTDKFFISQKYGQQFDCVSNISNKKVSGCLLTFPAVYRFDCSNGAELSGYTEESIASIVLPTTDSHPAHKH